jgi:hypothetical protein
MKNIIIKKILHHMFCTEREYVTRYRENRMFLACLHCAYESKGWEIDESVYGRINSIRSIHVSTRGFV